MKLCDYRSGQGTYQNPYKNLSERKKNCGKAGRKIKLQTNHFGMSAPDRTIFRYEVAFKLPWKRDIRKKDQPILINAVEALKAKLV